MKGKYNSERDKALHYLCCIGWGNDGFGDTEDYGLYLTRISNESADTHRRNTEFNSLIEEGADVIYTDEFRRSITGHFLVKEDSQGFVTVSEYPSQAALITAYNEAENLYNEWSEVRNHAATF